MEDNTVKIYCRNTQSYISVPVGSTLLDVYKMLDLRMPYGPSSAKVNNKTEGLTYKVFRNKDVEFLDICSSSGMRTYMRSLCFVLCKAVEDLFPKGHLVLENPISKGYYCNLYIGRPVTVEDVANIKKRMQEIISVDIPFHRIECHTEEAIGLFRDRGMNSKVKLLESIGTLYTFYYTLDHTVDYYYGSLLPSTGYIHLFDLIPYYNGLLLRIPNRNNPMELEPVVSQTKMFDIYNEHHRWQEILGVRTVGDFNQACQDGHATDLINVSEALQEKKIAHIADEIAQKKSIRLILIAGPSSSGKTTFSKRLSVQLMASGLHPLPISLDNYFVDRKHTPLDANGDYDYESLYALDLDYFNHQLECLLRGEEIELPRFNFQKGEREMSGQKIHLEEGTYIILEGIHALNPELTNRIPDYAKYKIYVSALTTILLDDHNYIPTADNRLLRRIIRDYKYRGYTAEDTIRRWPSVRRGEEKWIFPYQENANAMFNSALLYELAVLKDEVLPLLQQVQENVPEYSEAKRLCRFLSYFTSLGDEELPPTSLLREFLGGSSFKY